MRNERTSFEPRPLTRVLRAMFTLFVLLWSAHVVLNPSHRSDGPGAEEPCVLPGCEGPLRVAGVTQERGDDHQGWVLPADASTIDPGLAGEVDDVSWWRERGAVPVGGARVLLDLRGGTAAVLIHDLTLDSTCTRASDGVLFYDPGATVDEGVPEGTFSEGTGDHGAEYEEVFEEPVEEPSRVALVADLDTGKVLENVPYPLHVSTSFPGDPYFAHRGVWIGPGQTLRLSVDVTPRARHCEYVLRVHTAQGPRVWTTTVDDEGEPFEVGSIAGDASGSVDLTRYERIHLHGDHGWT